MLALAHCQHVPGIAQVRRLTLPDDRLPAGNAVVGVGHALNYLPDVPAVHRVMAARAAPGRAAGGYAQGRSSPATGMA